MSLHCPPPHRALLASTLLIFLPLVASGGTALGQSEWVYPSPDDGRLVYKQDEQGNRIPDFSHVGYRSGEKGLPDVPAVVEIQPGPGDDGSRIQAAIDEVGGMPMDDTGFRGAVLLKAGTYEIEGQLRLNHSGVVLRGEGPGEDGTVLVATGDSRRTLIVVGGEGGYREVEETRHRIVESVGAAGERGTYAPVGTLGAAGRPGHLQPGDRVIVERPGTAEWISAIGMDRIPQPRGRSIRQWEPGDRDLLFERTITNIYSGWISFDVPLTNAFEERFGGGYVYKYTFPGRIRNAGVENLRGVSQFSGPPEDQDEAHSWTFIQLSRIEDAWVRDITAVHFPFAAVQTTRTALRITVQDSRYLDPVGGARGGGRYPFHLNGQLVLFQRLYSEGARRDFSTGANVTGPNVVLDCVAADAISYSGPHHRWATGVLYDNVSVEDHDLRVQNRLNWGTGHGWPGANIVFWNSEARQIAVESPPTARNWAIGNIGDKGVPAFVARGDHSIDDFPGTWDSHGERVYPRSLYLRQLEERLGPEAVQRVAGGMDYSFDYEFRYPEEPVSSWVQRDPDGKLDYLRDRHGNRIPDFSHAGYGGGGVPLPEVPVRETVEPAAGDDGGRIQAAIDRVAAMEPDEDGFRGAVLLRAGTYHVEDELVIGASGVVLRGEGDGKDGTVLVATGRRDVERGIGSPFITIGGRSGEPREIEDSRRRIRDDTVPVGERTFRVDDAASFAPGDRVMVFRPGTAEWLDAIGMSAIPEAPWQPGDRDLHFDRIVTAVEGDRITVDAPVTTAIETRFGGGYLYRYAFPERISRAGVENLRGIADFRGEPEDQNEDHRWVMISITRAENVWVRDITSYHFVFGLARTSRHAKWVTVQDSRCREPVSEIRGNRRYPYYLAGQLVLFQRLYSEEARHDVASGANVPGPSVFLDCVGYRSIGDSGPHHRWANGTLYDNVRVPDGSLRAQNRTNPWNGHGWAGANIVFWNSRAHHFVVQNPPTARNWVIGGTGLIAGSWAEGDRGVFDSHNRPVTPQSLYLAQLEERLGPGAVANISDHPYRFEAD